jgi:hypothetical protein
VQTTAAGDVTGLLTGQKSVTDILTDLDNAFNKGKG